MKESIEIKPLDHGEIPQAARVVARAMLHNPLHLAVFGSADLIAEQMQVKMFEEVLKLPQCNLFAARAGGEIVGLMNYYKAGCCQIKPVKTLSMLPVLFGALGLKLFRVLKWKASWAKYDPKPAHFHFGPVAVLPSMQGNGIGSILISQFCIVADMHKMPAYLETDKIENVQLYERFGFRVIEEDTLFGVKNWFMWRAINTNKKT